MSFDTLKSRADFLRVRKGCQYRTPNLILQAAASQGEKVHIGGKQSGPPRFGFTVTKQVGSAVVRNRVRRRLKEAARLLGPLHARCGIDYVLIARHDALNSGFDGIVGDLRMAFQKVHRSNNMPAASRQRRNNSER